MGVELRLGRVERYGRERISSWESLSYAEMGGVLVQPEMEKGRSPLVSIPPFRRGF
jgi:hypothetical protein